MTKPIDRAAMKAQTRELLQTAQVSPKGMTALYCACLFLLSLLEALIPGPELVSTFLSILTTLAEWILAAGFASTAWTSAAGSARNTLCCSMGSPSPAKSSL